MITEPNLTVLIVDDDAIIHQLFRSILPSQWKLISAKSKKDLPKTFANLAFIDMHLNHEDANGLEVIAEVSKNWPQTEVVAISGDIRRDLMESALLHGAARFIGKPLQKEEVLLILEKAQAHHELLTAHKQRYDKVSWVGNSDFSKKLLRKIADLKNELGPVFIYGETGTGKEVVAKLLSQQESKRPFVSVNIAEIQENLFESELFGHVKGAFTGADQNKIGLIEAANGGDLFLDEIEALPANLQVKLLRFLETGEVRKVGSKDKFYTTTRLITASNEKLEDLVAEGKFREDLLFRISGHKLVLAPLRERHEDIVDLAQYFLASNRPFRKKSIEPDGLALLQKYDWPGNTRELKRICEQASLNSPLPLIRAEDLQTLLRPSKSTSKISPQTSLDGTSTDLTSGLDNLLAIYEKELLQQALKKWKTADEAAIGLKISRSSFYKKLRDYHLDGDKK